jgi:hypothetical protein
VYSGIHRRFRGLIYGLEEFSIPGLRIETWATHFIFHNQTWATRQWDLGHPDTTQNSQSTGDIDLQGDGRHPGDLRSYGGCP